MTSLNINSEYSTDFSKPAGKIFPRSGSAKDCLQPSPPSNFASCGDATELTKNEEESAIHQITHGISSLPSLSADQLVNPQRETLFQKRLLEKNEEHYASKCSPLGKIRRCKTWSSSGAEIMPNNSRCYGKPTERLMAAGEVVNPKKSWKEVQEESEICHELYTKTHNDYYVGEMYDRKYDWSNRDPKTTRFGIETPHFNDGRNVAKSLKGQNEKSIEKTTIIVSKKVDDFRERTQPQLGKTHDPIADTLNVGPNHSFGIIIKPDEYGVGDLLHMRSPRNYLMGKDRKLGVLSLVRHHLKKANYHNFIDLQTAFKQYDSDNSGYLDAQKIRDACWRFNLPIDNELLGSLMHYCAVEEGKEANECKLDYVKFVNFLNWREKFTDPNVQTEDETQVPRLAKQIDKAMTSHITSSSAINAVVASQDTSKHRTYGIPTIRSDLPAPRIKRISDSKDYGDEYEANALVSPSVYTNHGVFEQDFFEPRPRDEIRRIFEGIGATITDEAFDKIWEMAVTLTGTENGNNSKASVEAFRSVLDELQAASIDNCLVRSLDIRQVRFGELEGFKFENRGLQ